MTKKASELIFISQINRDGTGVIDVSQKSKSFNPEAVFELHKLSIIKDTYIAFNFNVYVVKIKND